MKHLSRLALLVIAAGSLAACNKADNAPGPGGVSVGEAKALDAAAEMIESEAPPQPGLASPSGPSPARP